MLAFQKSLTYYCLFTFFFLFSVHRIEKKLNLAQNLTKFQEKQSSFKLAVAKTDNRTQIYIIIPESCRTTPDIVAMVSAYH